MCYTYEKYEQAREMFMIYSGTLSIFEILENTDKNILLTTVL